MRKLSKLKTLLLVIGTLLPVVARADYGGAIDNNRWHCVNKFALILAWRPVQSVEDEITDTDAASAQSAYLDAEKGPPGKTEVWSNPATHHSGKVTRITEDQNYPAKGITCFEYEHWIMIDEITTRDREQLCWPTKSRAPCAP
jgi:hypothetical protein